MNEQLHSITNDLFSRNAVEVLDGGDATDALYDSLVEKADSAISEYGWKAVFESWKTYMYENCHTVEEALSFATWFEIYGGHNHRYNAQIMDDVSYGLLEASGIKTDLWTDDSYTTETDPELIKAVEALRKEKA